jgi:hypothetical protein
VRRLPVPEPERGEVRVRLHAPGINFADTYIHTGPVRSSNPYCLGRPNLKELVSLKPLGMLLAQSILSTVSSWPRGSQAEHRHICTDGCL